MAHSRKERILGCALEGGGGAQMPTGCVLVARWKDDPVTYLMRMANPRDKADGHALRACLERASTFAEVSALRLCCCSP